MPFYRGIEQSRLLNSINEGLYLLEKYSIGAECQKHIDEIRAVDPASGASSLDGITQAKSDLALAQAVRQCKAADILNSLHSVMKYHALNNTAGIGLQVFENLSQWGAFDDSMSGGYSKIDGERQGWLLCRYARKIADGQASPSLKHRFMLAAEAIFDRESGAERKIGKRLLKEAVRQAKKDTTDQSIVNYFNTLNISDRHVLLDTAMIMAGMTPEKLQNTSPIGRYGVVVDDLQTKRISFSDPSVTAVVEDVEKALRRFDDLDEVGMTGIGRILLDSYGKNDPLGVIFCSTKRAAEAVALAMPMHKVIDSKGKAVLSSSPSQPKAVVPKLPLTI